MELLAEHWRILTGVFIGAFGAGIIAMMYFREGVRKMVADSTATGSNCPIVIKGETPYSKTQHDVDCSRRWAEHDKNSIERAKTTTLIAEKDRTMVMAEIDHLQKGMEKMNKTVDKIFDKLERIHNAT